MSATDVQPSLQHDGLASPTRAELHPRKTASFSDSAFLSLPAQSCTQKK